MTTASMSRYTTGAYIKYISKIDRKRHSGGKGLRRQRQVYCSLSIKINVGPNQQLSDWVLITSSEIYV